MEFLGINVMELLGIVVAILILGFTAWKIHLISKRGTITETSWAEIRVIGYKTINSLIKLYNIKQDKDEFADYIIDEIVDIIDDSSKLTAEDKSFWNKENLTAIFKPVILNLITELEKKLNK